MRQQYHSPNVKEGEDRPIWDVNKLVKLAEESLSVIDVELSEIKEIDEEYWFNNNCKRPTCREIAIHIKLTNETDLNHPILLHPDGRVIDGMHRVCKALVAGHKTIKARQFKEMPPPDYMNVDWDNLPYHGEESAKL